MDTNGMTAGAGAPPGTRVGLSREADALTIYIPPSGLRGRGRSMLFFAFIWNGFMAFFTPMWFAGGGPGDVPGMVCAIIALFWLAGAWIVFAALRSIFGKTFVHIDGDAITLKKTLFGLGWARRRALGEAPAASVKEAYQQNSTSVCVIAVKTGRGKAKFGMDLTRAEQQWLAREVNAFVGAPADPSSEDAGRTFRRGTRREPSVEAPTDTRVKAQRDADTLTIQIPAVGARGPGCFLLGFALFWNGFMVVFTIGMVTGGGLEDSPGMLIPFLGLFWLIGAGLAIAAVRVMRTRTLIRVEQGALYIQKTVFQPGKLETYELGGVAAARMEAAYEQNDQPVYKVVVETASGRAGFGTGLSRPEKEWLVEEINAFLGVATEPLAGKRTPVKVEVEETRVEGHPDRPARVTADVTDTPARDFHVRFASFGAAWFGRLLVLGILGMTAVWVAGVVWIIQGASRGGDILDTVFGPMIGMLFLTVVVFMALFRGLPTLLRRAELSIGRDHCRVHNVVAWPRRENDRSVPVEDVEELVLCRAGIFNFCAVKRRGGSPMSIYVAMPRAELEWIVGAANRALEERRKM